MGHYRHSIAETWINWSMIDDSWDVYKYLWFVHDFCCSGATTCSVRESRVCFWRDGETSQFHSIQINNNDKIRIICPNYSPICLQTQNKNFREPNLLTFIVNKNHWDISPNLNLFHIRKKVIYDWGEMRMSEWCLLKNDHFWINPFSVLLASVKFRKQLWFIMI